MASKRTIKTFPQLEWTIRMEKEERPKHKRRNSLFFCLLTEPPEQGLLLGFALGGHGLHGLLYGFRIAEERHGLYGLQVCVQLVHDWDACRQVQIHNGCIGHTWIDRPDGVDKQISRQNRENVTDTVKGCSWADRKDIIKAINCRFSLLYFKLF